MCFVVLVGSIAYFACAVFKSEFLGLVFAKSAFVGLPILRVLPQLGTANQRTQPSIFFDRVTLGMRGLVFTTEGINRN